MSNRGAGIGYSRKHKGSKACQKLGKTHYSKSPYFVQYNSLSCNSNFFGVVKIWIFGMKKNTKNHFLVRLSFYRLGWVEFANIKNSKQVLSKLKSYFLDKNWNFNMGWKMLKNCKIFLFFLLPLGKQKRVKCPIYKVKNSLPK